MERLERIAMGGGFAAFPTIAVIGFAGAPLARYPEWTIAATLLLLVVGAGLALRASAATWARCRKVTGSPLVLVVAIAGLLAALALTP